VPLLLAHELQLSCVDQAAISDSGTKALPLLSLCSSEVSMEYNSDNSSNAISAWGSSATSPPVWLRWFANEAAQAILDTAVHAPIGCHYHYGEERSEWEVTVFVSDTEVVGGPRDGTLVPCRIQVDLSHALGLFDEMPRVHWLAGAVREDEDLDQHVSLEGQVRGHHVWLRVLAQAPQQAGPGRLLYASTGTLEDLW
jgi:hypothetical protein